MILKYILSEKQNEDCLHINVFSNLECTPDDPCPVLYLIHGGANEFLSAIYLPEDIVIEKYVQERLVFVNANYRLGIMGFWSTGTEEASGNWALQGKNFPKVHNH